MGKGRTKDDEQEQQLKADRFNEIVKGKRGRSPKGKGQGKRQATSEVKKRGQPGQRPGERQRQRQRQRRQRKKAKGKAACSRMLGNNLAKDQHQRKAGPKEGKTLSVDGQKEEMTMHTGEDNRK
jgi:hypothetical protein